MIKIEGWNLRRISLRFLWACWLFAPRIFQASTEVSLNISIKPDKERRGKPKNRTESRKIKYKGYQAPIRGLQHLSTHVHGLHKELLAPSMLEMGPWWDAIPEMMGKDTAIGSPGLGPWIMTSTLEEVGSTFMAWDPFGWAVETDRHGSRTGPLYPWTDWAVQKRQERD